MLTVRKRKTFTAERYVHPDQIPEGVVSEENPHNGLFYGRVISTGAEMMQGDYVVDATSNEAQVYDETTFFELFEEVTV